MRFNYSVQMFLNLNSSKAKIIEEPYNESVKTKRCIVQKKTPVVKVPNREHDEPRDWTDTGIFRTDAGISHISQSPST